MPDGPMDVRSLGSSFDEIRANFRWQIPARFNIAVDTVDRWAEATPRATALIHEDEDGAVHELSFADVREASARLANALVGLGLTPRDRVAVLLPQAPETA